MDFKTATLISKNVPAAKYHDLVFETPEPFVFEAGQFVTLKINDKKMNAYSIAGKVDNNKFGLLIDTTPGGLGSQMIEKIQVGDQVSFIGPNGHMILKNDDSEEIIFMAVGCGIAPIKALLEKALKENKWTKPMTLYFGVRFPRDIFWDKYFNDLQTEYSNFKFVLCLSKPDSSWTGVSGHITEILKTEKGDLSKASAYICGNEKMTDEAVEILKSKHCPEQRIYFEKYG
ncbi:hypothetical protein GYA19_01710 [Candidatus Beckwithbacteria bacterium]|nr:hypothetical protein [Candidatus Beckwithbacteria bacterium]